MRSRPTLQVHLSPSPPVPGATLRVDVHLDSQSETPFDAIDVELVGKESRYWYTSSTGNTTSSHYHDREILRRRHSFPGGTLTVGKHTRSVLFPLPPDAPPTYKSSLSSVRYELSVRVRIPWWPDRHQRYTIRVLAPGVAPGPPSPRVYSTRAGAPPGDEPVIELSLSDEQAPIGGQLLGALAFSNLKGRKLRRVELTLGVIETARVESSTGPTAVDQRTFVLTRETPAEGASLPFRLAIPEDLAPAFVTPFLQTSHELAVNAVVAFGRDLGLRVPLRIQRPGTPTAPPSNLPLVGKDRHTALFREALDALRAAGYDLVQEDPSSAAVTFLARGIQVRVVEEHRDGLGPCLVADLDGPPLGLDLRLCERSWTDLGARLSGVDAAFQKRFTVRAREEAQVVALLTADLREALASFDEAALDDEGAIVLARGGARDRQGLLRFFSAARRLALALADAVPRVPPPAALASAFPAYHRFAERHGISLCAGDLSLRGWSVGGVGMTLDHTFERGSPTASRLWAPLPAREEVRWFEAIASATEHPPLLSPERSGITLPLCSDPQSILSLAEHLADTLASLARGQAAGPYR